MTSNASAAGLPSILAIIAARNEADVIGQTVGDLIDQGIDVYLLDDNSTDGTADCVRPWLGSGVRGIETLEPDPADRFSLRRILARKEELARTLEADWYLNHDADELRESPVGGLSFAQAIGLVDRLGFNAIDFAVHNFIPTDDAFVAGADLRASFPYYEPGGAFDRTQIRCWKRQPLVDLQTSGGHDVAFAGRRVFPIRFILRHYPVRTSAQGRRKIFEERLPRFDPVEVERGWHVQYHELRPEAPLLRSASTLSRFDVEAIRVTLSLNHRDVEALDRKRDALERKVAAGDEAVRSLKTELTKAHADLASLQSSRTWRWTAPLRRIASWFGIR